MTNFLLAIAEPELRAISRLLHGVLLHEHPMVQRAVVDALADASRADALRGAQHLEGALLAATLQAVVEGNDRMMRPAPKAWVP